MPKLPEIHPSDLYRLLGKSLCATQVLDHTVAYCLGLWLELPPDKTRKMVESSLKKTFGQLLATLRKHGLVPDGFDARLGQYRNERNWLVHRFYAENYEDIFSASKVVGLVNRITAVHGEARGLIRVFNDLNDQWFDANGLPRQALRGCVSCWGVFVWS